jgi:hypothetical protein
MCVCVYGQQTSSRKDCIIPFNLLPTFFTKNFLLSSLQYDFCLFFLLPSLRLTKGLTKSPFPPPKTGLPRTFFLDCTSPFLPTPLPPHQPPAKE